LKPDTGSRFRAQAAVLFGSEPTSSLLLTLLPSKQNSAPPTIEKQAFAMAAASHGSDLYRTTE
jgi:hypothetical protein